MSLRGPLLTGVTITVCGYAGTAMGTDMLRSIFDIGPLSFHHFDKNQPERLWKIEHYDLSALDGSHNFDIYLGRSLFVINIGRTFRPMKWSRFK